jgi:hypothetical protein
MDKLLISKTKRNEEIKMIFSMVQESTQDKDAWLNQKLKNIADEWKMQHAYELRKMFGEDSSRFFIAFMKFEAEINECNNQPTRSTIPDNAPTGFGTLRAE